MALVEGYLREPNLLDIPLFRQRLNRSKINETGMDLANAHSGYANTVGRFNERTSYYSSASEALEGYIRDFQRRPAVNYGGTLEHIPVIHPRPPSNPQPQRHYLPSVTELLSSDAASSASKPTSPTKSVSPRQTTDPDMRSDPNNPMKGIFWEVTEEPRQSKEPRLSLSPIKPSPFDKLLELPLRPRPDVESIATDDLCSENAFRRFSVSPQKASPFDKLVDLSIRPLTDVQFHDDPASHPHPCPSWIGDITVDTDSITDSQLQEAGYSIPDWVRELQEADGSEVMSIISRRMDVNSSATSVNSARRAPCLAVGEKEAGVKGHGTRDARFGDRDHRKELFPSTDADIRIRRRNRTKSEDRFCNVAVLPEYSKLQKEKSLSWSSIAEPTDKHVGLTLEKRGAIITDKMTNDDDEVDEDKFLPLETADETASIPSDSVSRSEGRVGKIASDRPMEKLKNMLFTVQTLDSSNEKSVPFLEDKDLARLAVDSEPLQKAFQHLSQVRDIINASPRKMESDSQCDQPSNSM